MNRICTKEFSDESSSNDQHTIILGKSGKGSFWISVKLQWWKEYRSPENTENLKQQAKGTIIIFKELTVANYSNWYL